VSFEYKAVGFISLGAIGKLMAGHLAKKLPPDTVIYVFDVVQAAVDQLCTEFPDRVVKSANAKEVAEKSVRVLTLNDKPDLTNNILIGYYFNNGPRRITCQIRVSRSPNRNFKLY
jgi:pyrroline-5-carboxylate reductase